MSFTPGMSSVVNANILTEAAERWAAAASNEYNTPSDENGSRLQAAATLASGYQIAAAIERAKITTP